MVVNSGGGKRGVILVGERGKRKKDWNWRTCRSWRAYRLEECFRPSFPWTRFFSLMETDLSVGYVMKRGSGAVGRHLSGRGMNFGGIRHEWRKGLSHKYGHSLLVWKVPDGLSRFDLTWFK